MSNPPFTVRAVFEYASGHDDDLSFSIGQVITVTDVEDAEWYSGGYTDGSGGKQEAPAEPEVAEQLPADEPEPISQQPPALALQSPPLVSSPPVEEPTSPAQLAHPVPAPFAPAADPAPPVVKASKPPPPAVAEKPSSFKDRIAAFNKSAATPITPFAPEPAPKVYKREEDPDVQEQIAREPPVSESRPPPPPPQTLPQETEEGVEDQPKPTSLKDRIALLQKQQLEQAARHAEAAQKKEKPKPPKKPVEQPIEATEPFEDTEASPVTAPTAARDPSVDTVRSKPPPPQPPTPLVAPEEITSDANDADYSAAADSEDAGETSTSKDDEDERPRQLSTHTIEPKAEEADVEEGTEEEEEEMDPETRRRMELRERMAKMSGGTGMMGLFGPPGGMPGMSAHGTRKPKTPGESEKRLGEPEPTSPGNAPPVPMIPMPGMNLNTKPAPPDVEKEDEEPLATPVSEQHPSREVPDVEEVVHEGSLPRRSTDRVPPAPPAHGMLPYSF
ncbi:hypothetical protein N7481_011461 [Penicillium waksmanii]|uniref:uncharacterized protein n=1 Tax=Penicillium waksmanii TaxID=69791 RepID=UPI0025469E25|nr:uncharacterized protein N7481_011461 [Penicillium waksmanii]KAJ5974251.1 hypothetical protein N7481_011461 [Penicillium waksmanii]